MLTFKVMDWDLNKRIFVVLWKWGETRRVLYAFKWLNKQKEREWQQKVNARRAEMQKDTNSYG